MSEFITDVEQQYEVYCKIAEEYGFIDLNAKKNGFRCTTKSNEFNAGWIAFTGVVAAVRDEQQAKIDELKAKNEKTQKQFNFLLDKNIRDESAHATLKLKFMEVSRLVRSLRGEFDLWSDSPPVERQIELLEEIMRGGHE